MVRSDARAAIAKTYIDRADGESVSAQFRCFRSIRIAVMTARKGFMSGVRMKAEANFLLAREFVATISGPLFWECLP